MSKQFLVVREIRVVSDRFFRFFLFFAKGLAFLLEEEEGALVGTRDCTSEQSLAVGRATVDEDSLVMVAIIL